MLFRFILNSIMFAANILLFRINPNKEMYNKSKNCLQNNKEIYFCSRCKVYHLLVVVLAYQVLITQKQINKIKKHLSIFYSKYWEEKFHYSSRIKKTPNLICKEHLILIFNKNEFQIFKSLLNINYNRSIILTVDFTEYYLIFCSD